MVRGDGDVLDGTSMCLYEKLNIGPFSQTLLPILYQQ